jgi:arylformamidase
MPIDYEVEYNNRARVPDHPEIFARWEHDAAAYREEASAQRRSELGIKFGPSARQTIDLFMPPGGDMTTLAMFVHGGYWRSLEPSMFSHMAKGLNARGVAVAVSGYDLAPQVSIADIIAQTQRACLYLWWRFQKRVMVSGHSAGGHLAACLLATDWSAMGADVPKDLVPAAYAISGIYDLEPLTHLESNADFKLDAESARRSSPLFWPVEPGLEFDAVVGGAESSEFLRHSKTIAEQWGERGVRTRYEEIPGANHFNILDPMTDPDSAMVMRIAALAEKTR